MLFSLITFCYCALTSTKKTAEKLHIHLQSDLLMNRFCCSPFADWLERNYMDCLFRTISGYVASLGKLWSHFVNFINSLYRSQAPSNCKVQISFNTFDSFGIYAHTQDQCYHWLEVKYTNDFGKAGPRYVSYIPLKV